jgi:hypothetical protein
MPAQLRQQIRFELLEAWPVVGISPMRPQLALIIHPEPDIQAVQTKING